MATAVAIAWRAEDLRVDLEAALALDAIGTEG
jgi:hypothetical protein